MHSTDLKGSCLLVHTVNLVHFPQRPFSILSVACMQMARAAMGCPALYYNRQLDFTLERSAVLCCDYIFKVIWEQYFNSSWTLTFRSSSTKINIKGLLILMAFRSSSIKINIKRLLILMASVDRISTVAVQAMWACICTYRQVCRYYQTYFYVYMYYIMYKFYILNIYICLYIFISACCCLVYHGHTCTNAKSY